MADNEIKNGEETSYRYLVEKVGNRKFEERLRELVAAAESFISEAGYGEHVECNERIMLNVLFDYFSDIFRLKDFHDIDKVRTEKITAYTIAWIVKRKPLQFTHYTDEERDIFVNERFAAFLFLNECMPFAKMRIAAKDKDKLDFYIDLILYYLKYRECNPQVIELAIESFKMGTLVKKFD